MLMADLARSYAAVLEDLRKRRDAAGELHGRLDQAIGILHVLAVSRPEAVPAADGEEADEPPANGDRPPITRGTQRDVVLSAAKGFAATYGSRPFTSADLAKATGLELAKVSAVLTNLVAEGYVTVVEKRYPSQGGNRHRVAVEAPVVEESC